jgi:hypothetical protein
MGAAGAVEVLAMVAPSASSSGRGSQVGEPYDHLEGVDALLSHARRRELTITS